MECCLLNFVQNDENFLQTYRNATQCKRRNGMLPFIIHGNFSNETICFDVFCQTDLKCKMRTAITLEHIPQVTQKHRGTTFKLATSARTNCDSQLLWNWLRSLFEVIESDFLPSRDPSRQLGAPQKSVEVYLVWVWRHHAFSNPSASSFLPPTHVQRLFSGYFCGMKRRY